MSRIRRIVKVRNGYVICPKCMLGGHLKVWTFVDGHGCVSNFYATVEHYRKDMSDDNHRMLRSNGKKVGFYKYPVLKYAAEHYLGVAGLVLDKTGAVGRLREKLLVYDSRLREQLVVKSSR
jgi:hypothetical protein